MGQRIIEGGGAVFWDGGTLFCMKSLTSGNAPYFHVHMSRDADAAFTEPESSTSSVQHERQSFARPASFTTSSNLPPQHSKVSISQRGHPPGHLEQGLARAPKGARQRRKKTHSRSTCRT